MKNLILILTLFIGLATSAQSIEVTIFDHDGTSYTHLKGSGNSDEVCFDNVSITSSYTLAIDLIGSDLANIHLNSIAYSFTGNGGGDIVSKFDDWNNYNRIYRNRGSNRPLHIEGSDLLDCPVTNPEPMVMDEWTLAEGNSWYSNPANPGYFYQPFAGTAFFAYVPNGGTCEGNQGCQQYSATNPNAFSLTSFLATPNFDDNEAIEAYFSTLISEREGGSGIDGYNLIEGEWTFATSVAAGGSTLYRWTNPADSRQITWNTVSGFAQLWDIVIEEGNPVASLVAASTQTLHGSALAWATNLIRVSEEGAAHRAMVDAQNALKRDIAAIVTDRSMRQQVNFEVTSVRLWSVVGYAQTEDIDISIDDHDGSVARVQARYDYMVGRLQDARNRGHLND